MNLATHAAAVRLESLTYGDLALLSSLTRVNLATHAAAVRLESLTYAT